MQYHDAITAGPRTDFTAVHSSGLRKLSDIRWVVLHDEEAPTAESAARYFTNKDSGGSAHECVDGGVCFKTLDARQIPWAAPGANTKGYHIEQAGYARWLRWVWKSKANWPIVQRAAWRTAVACYEYGLGNPVFVDYRGLRQNRKGVTTHAEVTKAFPDLARKSGSHTDPGPNWPRADFMATVREYYSHLAAHGHTLPPGYKRPEWFYDFDAWWEGREEFKQYGPRNMKHRPKNIPKKIPAGVWVDLEKFIADRK